MIMLNANYKKTWNFPSTKDTDNFTWEVYLLLSILSGLLVAFAGIISGLTVGLLSIDIEALESKALTGTEKEKLQAMKILPLIKKHHLLLVSLIIVNSLALEALPLILESMIGDIGSIIISVTIVLIFGEIIPQSICTGPKQIEIAYKSILLIKSIIYILLPIAWPLSKLLDKISGSKHKRKINKNEIKNFILTTYSKSKNIDPARLQQLKIIVNLIDINSHVVNMHMIPIEQVFSLSSDTLLTRHMLCEIKNTGFSRIPIYERHEKSNIIGILLLKRLVGVDENIYIKNSGIKLIEPLYVQEEISFYDLLNIFRQGKSHVAFVTGLNKDNQSPSIIGMITLEDVIRNITKLEIKEIFSEPRSLI
ncbi:unnamed protein product [Blepharisma stoltei]|uniref:CNNM transmembrane domain-containing protein n=1 Tax=Blepharisma stoltei TaxID=1481888 RepID=A0AAU9JJE5_9CILI|nr:unnamed protein product [Blepharisma stoltei]